jgi:uncharacterized protein (TIGR02246 family)
MRSGTLAALAGIIAVAGCTKGQAATSDTTQAATAGHTAAASTSPADARHAIDSTNSKMSDAIAHGDAKTASAMYASDAIADFPGAPILSGPDAIGKGFEQQAASGTFKDVTLHTDDVLTGGDLAVENGTWSWTVTPKKGGKAEAQKGHYLTVWKRQADGTWKIVRDYVTADPAGK